MMLPDSCEPFLSNFKAIIAINDISLTHFALTSNNFIRTTQSSNRLFEKKVKTTCFMISKKLRTLAARGRKICYIWRVFFCNISETF